MAKNHTESRNNNFGTLHLLAAIFVLYGHQCALLNQASPQILGSQIQAVGVKIIFLISGYLIVKSLLSEEENTLKTGVIFAVKRLGRLYPEFLFCLIISSILIGPIFSVLPLGEYFADGSWWRYILSNMLLYPTYNLSGLFLNNPYVGAVNGSLWTMPVEVFMYVVILFFGLLFRRSKIRNVIYAFFVSIVLSLFVVRMCYFPEARYVFYGTDWVAALNIIPYILVGGLFYLFDFRKKLNIQFAILLFLFAGMLKSDLQIVNELVSLLVLPYVVFSLGLAEEQCLRLRILKGEYAYGIYLWGFVVQQCVIQILVVRLGGLHTVGSLFIISMIVTYLIAMFSYEVIYNPCGKVIRNIVKRIRNNKK